MPKRRKLLALILVPAILSSLFSLCADASAQDSLSLSAKSAVLMNAESGEIYFSENADERLPMASTTKVMTALVALRLSPLDKKIRISQTAVGVEGSSLYLVEGEILTVEELLYALLLQSANDAAVALAVGISGSVDLFVAEMNRTAEELGLTDTHFENPHGLDGDTHYTTAKELAVITRAAIQNEVFRKIVSTKTSVISHPESGFSRHLSNHNKLLRTYAGCIGVKTGFTKKSGRCLVSAAERDGISLIAVTLCAPDDWKDHQTLFDYGFTHYRVLTLCEKESFSISVPVVGGKAEQVTVRNLSSATAVVPSKQARYRVCVDLPKFLYAPVSPGDTVGNLLFYSSDGDLIAALPLVVAERVERKAKKSFFYRIIQKFL